MALPTLTNANYLDILQKNGLSEDQFWSRSLQKMIVLEQSEFVFTKLAKKESIPGNYGSKIWTTRRYLHLPVDLEKGRLAEGVAPTPMTVEGVTVSGTVNQYGAYIELTDVSKDIHFDDIFNIYQPELARHAAETIERDLMDAVEAEASVRFAGSNTQVGTIKATDVVDFQDVRNAWIGMKNHFRKGHSLAGGKPIFVAHPNVLQDLLDDTNVVEDLIIVPGYDQKIIRSGSINEYTVYGIYFMESMVLDPVAEGASSANVYRSFLVGDGAFALLKLGTNDVKWYKKGFAADSGDPLGQKATLGYKLWTGGKVLDPMAVSVIYSGSGFDVEYADLSQDAYARPAIQTLASIAVTEAPDDVSYVVDTVFDPTGLVVTATDNYGTKFIVPNADLEFTYDFSAAATVNVTISYTLNGVTKTATQEVTVTSS